MGEQGKAGWPRRRSWKACWSVYVVHSTVTMYRRWITKAQWIKRENVTQTYQPLGAIAVIAWAFDSFKSRQGTTRTRTKYRLLNAAGKKEVESREAGKCVQLPSLRKFARVRTGIKYARDRQTSRTSTGGIPPELVKVVETEPEPE